MFYEKIKPYGLGWRSFKKFNKIPISVKDNESSMNDLLLMFLGILAIYFCLFGIGYLLFNENLIGSIMLIISFISGFFANYIMRHTLNN